jgi:hypothetical protein
MYHRKVGHKLSKEHMEATIQEDASQSEILSGRGDIPGLGRSTGVHGTTSYAIPTKEFMIWLRFCTA